MKPLFALGIAATLLSSCQTIIVSLPSQLGETPTLQGKAENWVGRALTIKLEVPIDSRLEYPATGSIDTDGSFRIALPGRAVMAPFLTNSKAAFKPEFCQTVNVQPETAKGSNAVQLAVFDGSNLIGRIALEPSRFSQVGDVFAALLFTDQAASFNVTCASDTITNHLHADVEVGWYFDINEIYAPKLAHEYVGALPRNIKWTYSSAASSQ
jgi:hypothetical protein